MKNRLKSKLETPEKPELLKMFEKLAKKRVENTLSKEATKTVEDKSEQLIENKEQILNSSRNILVNKDVEKSSVSSRSPNSDKKRPKFYDLDGQIGLQSGRKSSTRNPLISQKRITNVGAVNSTVDGTIVRLPNLTSSKSQSETNSKRKTSEKKKRTVKEIKEEYEKKSTIPITCFFKEKNKTTLDLD